MYLRSNLKSCFFLIVAYYFDLWCLHRPSKHWGIIKGTQTFEGPVDGCVGIYILKNVEWENHLKKEGACANILYNKTEKDCTRKQLQNILMLQIKSNFSEYNDTFIKSKEVGERINVPKFVVKR